MIADRDNLEMIRDVKLTAVAVKGNAVSCRIPRKGRVIPLRPAGLWELVPGERIIAAPRKQWRDAGHPDLSGEVKAWRLDIALGPPTV